MVLPLTDCPDDVPADTCCDTLGLMADRIRTVAAAAVVACIDETCADREFASYFTIGPRVEDPLGESLVVVLHEFGPSIGSRTFPGNLLPAAVHKADFEVRLLETGWPTIEADGVTDQIYVPDRSLVNGLARHSVGHGEKVYRALTDGIQRRTLFAASTNPHIGQVSIDAMRPVQPSTHIAGWTMRVGVEVTL